MFYFAIWTKKRVTCKSLSKEYDNSFDLRPFVKRILKWIILKIRESIYLKLHIDMESNCRCFENNHYNLCGNINDLFIRLSEYYHHLYVFHMHRSTSIHSRTITNQLLFSTKKCLDSLSKQPYLVPHLKLFIFRIDFKIIPKKW